MSISDLAHDHPVPHHPLPDETTLDATAEMFKALSSPLRLAIVDQVHGGPKCVHELVDHLGVSQPLVSQHLRVLRAARIVSGERRGREIAYVLVDHHIGHIVSDALAHAKEPLE